MLEEISHLISHFNEIFNTLSTKDLVFLEFQEANQQNNFFQEEVRNTLLAPFNTKCKTATMFVFPAISNF